MNITKTSKSLNIFEILVLILLSFILLKTCTISTKKTDKKIDALTEKIDTLPTRTDLKIEGLRVEKRMIQSTDRKILDVNRQAEIDKELNSLNKQ